MPWNCLGPQAYRQCLYFAFQNFNTNYNLILEYEKSWNLKKSFEYFEKQLLICSKISIKQKSNSTYLREWDWNSIKFLAAFYLNVYLKSTLKPLTMNLTIKNEVLDELIQNSLYTLEVIKGDKIEFMCVIVLQPVT